MNCPWCEEEVKAEEYTQHLKTCPKYPRERMLGYIQTVKIPLVIEVETPVFDRLGKEELLNRFFEAIRPIHMEIGFVSLREVDEIKSHVVESELPYRLMRKPED